MHEMSIAASLKDICEQELEKNGLTKLLKVKIKHGKLSAIVPEALDMSFTAVFVDTPHEGAVVECEEVPLVLKCRQCGLEFSPEDAGDHSIFAPCPGCGEELGHDVVTGKELFIEYIEAE